MDYIFKEWEEKLKAFETNVEKDLEEIRKCKAEMQQLQVETINQMKKGYYLRDNQRLVLSAPEIIIGDVDAGGNLNSGSGSTVIVRGAQVGLQGVGSGGQVEIRATNIRETAEDPGIDGQEHVVSPASAVISQARNIILQSDDVDGAFSAPTIPASGSGVRIHADQQIEIGATATAESREKRLDDLISAFEERKSVVKELAATHKESFTGLVKDIEEQLQKKEKIIKDDDEVRGNYQDLYDIDDQIESLSLSLSEEVAGYAQTLSILAEVNRQIKCFKAEKGKIKKGDDFTKNSTGTSVTIASENISLSSVDGDGNYRDNESAGINILANKFYVKSVENDGALKEKGEVLIQAKDIKLESVDYELKEKFMQEKGLTADGKISVRAKTVEISTENSGQCGGRRGRQAQDGELYLGGRLHPPLEDRYRRERRLRSGERREEGEGPHQGRRVLSACGEDRHLGHRYRRQGYWQRRHQRQGRQRQVDGCGEREAHRRQAGRGQYDAARIGKDVCGRQVEGCQEQEVPGRQRRDGTLCRQDPRSPARRGQGRAPARWRQCRSGWQQDTSLWRYHHQCQGRSQRRTQGTEGVGRQRRSQECLQVAQHQRRYGCWCRRWWRQPECEAEN